jgi:hypothetical protein
MTTKGNDGMIGSANAEAVIEEPTVSVRNAVRRLG